MPKLTIDGRELSVPEGTTVIQAAEQLGVFIPRYCYHPGLSIAGNCRICLVDVEKSPKLQIACNTPVAEGMVVHTANAKAAEGRKSVLEFLLANHPLDCPVCDQSGECDLQNFYMAYGRYDPRFREVKVKKKKAVTLGPHVMLDQERCILCSRCVRFTDEITKTGEFGIFNRGDKAQVGLYPGQVLDNRYSANVVDVCPVGALTEREFRFKARVWYLSSASTLCNGCSRGCNVDVHFTLDRPHLNGGARVLRVKPRHNPDVNQWWMCDAGRYGFGPVDERRLRAVSRRGKPASWNEAYAELGAVLSRLRKEGSGQELGVISSARLGLEELFLLREVFSSAFKARVSAPPPAAGEGDDFLINTDKTPNSLGARLLGLSDGVAPESLLEDALSGKLKVLWVFGEELTGLCGQEKLAELAGKLELFVYAGPNESATAAAAHWVLPTAAYVEKDGTFVNFGGRVQRIGKAFPPLGDSREDWRILLELGRFLGLTLPARSPEQVFLEISRKVPAFAGLSYEKLGTQGAQLDLPKETAAR